MNSTMPTNNQVMQPAQLDIMMHQGVKPSMKQMMKMIEVLDHTTFQMQIHQLQIRIETASPTVQPANSKNESFQTNQTKQKVELKPKVSKQNVTSCNNKNLILHSKLKLLPKVNQRIIYKRTRE